MAGKLFTWSDIRRISRALETDIPESDSEYEGLLISVFNIVGALALTFDRPDVFTKFVGLWGFKFSEPTVRLAEFLIRVGEKILKSFPAGSGKVAVKDFIDFIGDFLPAGQLVEYLGTFLLEVPALIDPTIPLLEE